MSPKRVRSPQPQGFAQAEVYISSAIEDRGSTIIGLYSPTASAQVLQRREDVKTAAARPAAWRTPSAQKSISGRPIYDLGHDDDGEEYAGKKLERLLQDLNVEGTVIIARWWGGILLGPVRFTHFENCAKGAIAKWRESVGDETKRRKIAEEEKEEIEKLATSLKERDQSIEVLRDLLAEKTSAAKTPSQSNQTRPENKLDYLSMDLPTLKRLERARDGTLAWILKQIDKAEETQEEREPHVDSKACDEEVRLSTETPEKARDEGKSTKTGVDFIK